ncbi:MAG: D-glycero-beta-D-manno-heptose-7-phosphate kinase [Candidatus Altiarchaeota archaeon]|nr:D-glycero-beta-D-manno-heptose-7-phosphate kinase [Candidatus Altiarchaeota archaeon]
MTLASILEGFKGKRILVVGDMILDKFIYGDVSRISPEAPVPVLHATSESNFLGGAGNTANNLEALGAKVYLIGIVGGDKAGKEFIRELKRGGIDSGGVFMNGGRSTTVKTRVISRNQQILRIDNGSSGEAGDEVTRRLMDYIRKVLPDLDGVVVSDYGKGVPDHRILETLPSILGERHIPVVVDPSMQNFMAYKDITLLVSNQRDASQALGMKFINETSLRNAGHKLVSTLCCEGVAITRGKDGMTVFDKQGRLSHIPARSREVFDITGVSDTIASTFVLALSCGADLIEAAKLANCAGWVKVGKFGTATVNIKELKEALMGGDDDQITQGAGG